MRSTLWSPPSMARPLLLLLAAASVAVAGPYPKDDLHDAGYSYLQARACNSYCGADNQYCCAASEVCATLNGNVATCLAAANGFTQFTTTWTVTQTFTSTGFTFWAPVPSPTAGVDCVPQNSEQQACGPICCAGWQTCAFQGQCSAKPGFSSPTAIVVTSGGRVTTQYSAPFRVTGTTTIVASGVVSTGTRVASASATSTGDEAIGAGPDGVHEGGLSPGAIAGIVLGTLAGVALLLSLCFCCLARGLWGAIFGKKKDSGSDREEVVEERFSKHGGSRVPSAYSRRERHSGWFGRGDGATSSVTERADKKRRSAAKWFGLSALAATLLALLNLKKDKRPASHQTPSRYSDSYYSHSDFTSPTTSSSGGRTRTRVSRDSRGTRASRYSRQPKRP